MFSCEVRCELKNFEIYSLQLTLYLKKLHNLCVESVLCVKVLDNASQNLYKNWDFPWKNIHN